jgi:hypothetical protein
MIMERPMLSAFHLRFMGGGGFFIRPSMRYREGHT